MQDRPEIIQFPSRRVQRERARELRAERTGLFCMACSAALSIYMLVQLGRAVIAWVL